MQEDGVPLLEVWLLQIAAHWSHNSSLQELRGKIVLKAKKIGGPEEYLDETLTDEVSDEDEMANDDAEISENPSAEKKNKVNVHLYYQVWLCVANDWALYFCV